MVTYLCEECGVIVQDVNYDRVRCLEYSLFRAAAYRDNLYTLIDDLKRKLVVVESERDRLAASDVRYAALFSAGRMVAATFDDLIPLVTLAVDGLAGAPSTNSVMYAGSRPPGTRGEQLAAFLENFMNTGPSIASAVLPTVRMFGCNFACCMMKRVPSLDSLFISFVCRLDDGEGPDTGRWGSVSQE